MSDKEQEKKHLKAFLNRVENPPEGELSFAGPNEVPDLRVCSSEKVVGVEHQRLYHPHSTNGIIRQEQESLQKKVVRESRRIFEKRSDFNLNVTIHFWTLYGLSVDPTDIKLRSGDVNQVASQVANLVQKNIPNDGEKIEIRPSLDGDDFPSQIQSIDVRHPEDESYALWSSPEGGIVARFTSNFLERHINKKEEKIDRYKAGCSEVWLLLVADGSRFSTWFDKEMSQQAFEDTYSSDFSRIFVLDGPNLSLEELHTQS